MDGPEHSRAQNPQNQEGNRNWNHNECDLISCQSSPALTMTSPWVGVAVPDPTQAPPTLPQEAGSKLVVVPGNNRTAVSEKLEMVRRWSVTTYMCTRQTLSERLGTGSRTVDLDLEPQLEDLIENQHRYGHLTKLADTLANQMARFAVTQKSLGDALAELSLRSPSLNVQFGMNADAQHFQSRRGEGLATAVGSFSQEVNTLVSSTMEDTLLTVKQYQRHRVEYDAYRCDLEDLNLGPRDTSTRAKLDQVERTFQNHRRRYLQSRDDLSVKLQLLEENKVRDGQALPSLS
ncbi:hypothetical protein CRUP_004628 [Coryphaenoides rupestris]|nr:hypothetical protein CRUP_004628 [Coryphaenoides rupestris]